MIGFLFDIFRVNIDSNVNPKIMFVIIAVFNVRKITGIIKISAVRNFVVNAEIVLLHTFFFEFPAVSSEMWIPNESENASAIAIVMIPPKTTNFECVPEKSPTINPRVVIIPEVIPKPKPFFIDFFMVEVGEKVIKV